MTADQIIAKLRLAPHPEGGWYRQTWIAETIDGTRAAGTCIYFLLKAGERSHWHKIDADEIWHYYAGAPILLSIAANENGPAIFHTLGADLWAGMLPQIVVPARHWQAAESTGDFTLVGCTVSPGFQFSTFELAPPDMTIVTGPK